MPIILFFMIWWKHRHRYVRLIKSKLSQQQLACYFLHNPQRNQSYKNAKFHGDALKTSQNQPDHKPSRKLSAVWWRPHGHHFHCCKPRLIKRLVNTHSWGCTERWRKSWASSSGSTRPRLCTGSSWWPASSHPCWPRCKYLCSSRERERREKKSGQQKDRKISKMKWDDGGRNDRGAGNETK